MYILDYSHGWMTKGWMTGFSGNTIKGELLSQVKNSTNIEVPQDQEIWYGHHGEILSTSWLRQNSDISANLHHHPGH